MITAEQFSELFPHADGPEQWVELFERNLPQYDITTPERIAAFVSQCGVETGGWRWFEENLNYSADRMTQVWPNVFNHQLAMKCHRRPELVANYAYANRMGNGGPQTGDGWMFRGRGPIHLTGRANYTAFAKETFDNPDEVLDNPDLVALDKDVSMLSALWFWNSNKLNAVADTKDISRLSRKVNGGTNGLQERTKLFREVYSLLSE